MVIYILNHYHLTKPYLLYIEQNKGGHSTSIVIKNQRLITYMYEPTCMNFDEA